VATSIVIIDLQEIYIIGMKL